MTSPRSVVLHVIPSFTGGGAERQLALLAGAQVAAGATVHVAYLYGGPNLVEAQRSGASLHQIKVRSHYDIAAIRQLCDLIRKHHIQLVHSWLLHADVCACVAAKRCGIPWVLSERSSAAYYAGNLKFGLRRFLGRRADMIIANSKTGAQYWREARYGGALQVVRNIVTQRHEPQAPPAKQAKRTRRIVAVGRLSEEKNYPVLLKALETVLVRHPESAAEILGEGHLRQILQQQIDESPILRGRVLLQGFVDDVVERLWQAELFVSASSIEGMANALLDAARASCPMVLSDIESHREIVGDGAALFTPAGDHAALAESISRCLDDPALCEKLAQRALEELRLEEWSAHGVAERYLSHYDDLLRREGK